MADRFRGAVRWRLGGEELAERTHPREQAPQTASRQRAAERSMYRPEERAHVPLSLFIGQLGAQCIELVVHPMVVPGHCFVVLEQHYG